MSFINNAIMLVIGLVLMVALLPLINTLVSSANASNMSALQFGSVIQLLLGMAGLFIVILWIKGLFDQQEPPRAIPYQ